MRASWRSRGARAPMSPSSRWTWRACSPPRAACRSPSAPGSASSTAWRSSGAGARISASRSTSSQGMPACRPGWPRASSSPPTSGTSTRSPLSASWAGRSGRRSATSPTPRPSRRSWRSMAATPSCSGGRAVAGGGERARRLHAGGDRPRGLRRADLCLPGRAVLGPGPARLPRARAGGLRRAPRQASATRSTGTRRQSIS